jgi:hypothetical protein
VPYEIRIPVSRKDTIHDISVVYLPQIIDTQAILSDYYSQKKYLLPFKDSVACIEVDLTISENQINEATFQYEFLQQNTVITHTVIEESKWNAALGLGVSYSMKTKLPGINVNAGLDLKRNRILIGYDLINNTLGIAYEYKIIDK